jgi:anti-sigma B factor antagonist
MQYSERSVRLVMVAVVGLVAASLVWSFVSDSPVGKDPRIPAEGKAVGPPAVEGQRARVEDEHAGELANGPATSRVAKLPEPRADGPPAIPRRRLQVERNHEVTVVRFIEHKFTADEDCRDLGDQLDSLVEKGGHKQLLLNFEDVQYLSSPALTRLVQLKKKVNAAQGTIKLCCLSSDLEVLFKLTRADQFLDIYPDQQTALDAF